MSHTLRSAFICEFTEVLPHVGWDSQHVFMLEMWEWRHRFNLLEDGLPGWIICCSRPFSYLPHSNWDRRWAGRSRLHPTPGNIQGDASRTPGLPWVPGFFSPWIRGSQEPKPEAEREGIGKYNSPHHLSALANHLSHTPCITNVHSVALANLGFSIEKKCPNSTCSRL